MTAKQTRRLLIVAFVLSLLVHAIVLLFVRWPFRPAANVPDVVHLERVPPLRIAHVTPPPPPPPTPSPAPSAQPTIAAHRIVRRAARPNGTRPAAPASAPPSTPAATASPAPAASAMPNCAKTDTPVAVAAAAPPPNIPPAARTSTTGGTARVSVDVNASGAVTSAKLAQSSGDPQLDLIAISMARAAVYTPATRACKPIPSQYAYSVRFVAW